MCIEHYYNVHWIRTQKIHKFRRLGKSWNEKSIICYVNKNKAKNIKDVYRGTGIKQYRARNKKSLKDPEQKLIQRNKRYL